MVLSIYFNFKDLDMFSFLEKLFSCDTLMVDRIEKLVNSEENTSLLTNEILELIDAIGLDKKDVVVMYGSHKDYEEGIYYLTFNIYYNEHDLRKGLKLVYSNYINFLEEYGIDYIIRDRMHNLIRKYKKNKTKYEEAKKLMSDARESLTTYGNSSDNELSTQLATMLIVEDIVTDKSSNTTSHHNASSDHTHSSHHDSHDNYNGTTHDNSSYHHSSSDHDTSSYDSSSSSSSSYGGSSSSYSGSSSSYSDGGSSSSYD